MTSTEPKRDPGYRGALPTRHDRLAKPWLIIVGVIFVMIFVLSALQIPSRFVPEPTAVPTPSATAAPSGSGAASGSAEPSGSGAPSGSAEASASATP